MARAPNGRDLPHTIQGNRADRASKGKFFWVSWSRQGDSCSSIYLAPTLEKFLFSGRNFFSRISQKSTKPGVFTF
jgi:hypothetical protein